MLTMKDQVMDAIEAIEELYERKGGITGISTGFAELDRMTSGLHPAEMIVIAGASEHGKNGAGHEHRRARRDSTRNCRSRFSVWK